MWSQDIGWKGHAPISSSPCGPSNIVNVHHELLMKNEWTLLVFCSSNWSLTGRAQTMQNSCRLIFAFWLSVLAILKICAGQNIYFSGCGQSKSCFRVPKQCAPASCSFLLTWAAKDDGSVFFEMSAAVDSQNSYVAFGLSEDALMVARRFLYALHLLCCEISVLHQLSYTFSV